jgi:osmoprotectant transport system permease protein
MIASATLKTLLLAAGVALLLFIPLRPPRADLRIGSKKFTESVILGEMLTHLSQSADVDTIHLSELGGTRLIFDALENGAVDAYPEYTGTIRQEILAQTDDSIPVETRLRNRGIEISRPLGFNNTYALGLMRDRAAELGVKTIADLRLRPDLKLAFSNEFMDRADGWPGLQVAYGLPQRSVRGVDHDIAYRQLQTGSIDIMDVYSTDAKIETLDLVLLEDNLKYFPSYEAVWLYRSDLQERHPEVVEKFLRLEGEISDAEMTRMNARCEAEGVSESKCAGDFLEREMGIVTETEEESTAARIWHRTIEHLDLVRWSLIPAILFAIPLGVFAHRLPWLGKIVLAVTGLIQTIPALALLVMLIPVSAWLGLQSLGVGSNTAVLALFAYSLLPIVRNTHAGLSGVPRDVVESAEVLGISGPARLLKIELPMASSMILAGVETAAVQNVGFAALGALIGAGGYGQPILTGIRLNSAALILEGAIPAAALAVLVQTLFQASQRWIVPRGLRLAREA